MAAGSTTTATVRRVRARDLEDLDVVLYEGSLRDAGYADFASRRLEWTVQAVERSLATCPAYQRVAAGRGFRIEHLASVEDLHRVPLLSTGVFKRMNLNGPGTIERWCTSSGTTGSISRVPRCRRTLERFAATITFALREYLSDLDNRRSFILGPDPETVGDLWFSYALGLAEVFYDTEYFVPEDELDGHGLYRSLAEPVTAADPFERLLIGPPSLVASFTEWMRDTGRAPLALADTVLITAGGWKRAQSQALPREELAGAVVELLGIPSPAQFDAFNMVELNTVVVECAEHRKHIPPWLTVFARDPETLLPMPSGSPGLLSFLDPTAISYPAFVLGDDIGVVREADCPCGRDYPSFEIVRRLRSVEERGCGLKMQRYANSPGGGR